MPPPLIAMLMPLPMLPPILNPIRNRIRPQPTRHRAQNRRHGPRHILVTMSPPASLVAILQRRVRGFIRYETAHYGTQ